VLRPNYASRNASESASLLQHRNDFLRGFIGAALDGIDDEFGGFRRFVRRVDAREIRELPTPCLAIQAFHVPGLSHLERSIHENLDEFTVADQSARRFALGAERRGERRQAIDQQGKIDLASLSSPLFAVRLDRGNMILE